jgi:hypothetical protein
MHRILSGTNINMPEKNLFIDITSNTRLHYPDKPEIGNIKIENLKVKLRRLYNAMISQKNCPASHFTFSFLISHFSF